MKKISAKTQSREAKEELESRKSTEAAQKEVNEKETKTDDGSTDKKQKYTFEDDYGKKYEGEIVYEDKNGGRLHVEYVNEDGDKEVIQFGYKRGNQLKETGKKSVFRNGKRKVVDEEAEPTTTEDEGSGETLDGKEDPLETAKFPEKDLNDSESSADASQKANEEILGDFEVKEMSNKELEDLSVILNTIFDC
jgi:hypothetical protein